MLHSVREPAVAGLFYPQDPRELAEEVSAMLALAPEAHVAPKALIVPHAGFAFSGPIAASAYAALQGRSKAIERVVLLGPVHRVALEGVAVPTVGAFQTPLGQVQLDRDAIAAALTLRQVRSSDLAHASEHSMEVQLPFLQSILGEFKLVPLAVGHATTQEVAEVLALLWGGAETLILVSSDLSHYYPSGEARRLDRATADDILALRKLATAEQACGATPVNGLLAVARRKGLRVQLLDLRNSGDTAGDRSRVVGYGAFAFAEA